MPNAVSEAQPTANRQNPQHAGVKTPAGKAATRLNTLPHGRNLGTGGEGGIRTLGTVLPVHHISSVVLSATQPPLHAGGSIDGLGLGKKRNHAASRTASLPASPVNCSGVKFISHWATSSGIFPCTSSIAKNPSIIFLYCS